MHPTSMAVLAVERQRALRDEAATERLAGAAGRSGRQAGNGRQARNGLQAGNGPLAGGPLARLRLALTRTHRRHRVDPVKGT